MVGLVPFGIPNEQPSSMEHAPLPEGLDPKEPLVVWGGGMWDWLEPEIVVSAWPEVLKRYPSARLVFPGTEHPNPHVPVMAAVGRVRKKAKELGVLESLYFGRWLPRGEYLNLLASASCGVSAHSPGLEAHYAARTRYLDAIWIGLPMVVSEGDEYAEYVASHKLGVVVRESNPTDFANGIIRVLVDGKASLAENFTRARQRLSWRRMAAPLVEWAREPRLTHGPGSEFFQAVAGRATPRGRPADIYSLIRRIISRVKRT
jgi:glycosyltransferase involved in cell wall biosynthesis